MSVETYEGLHWVRVMTPMFIPKQLVRQVRDKEFNEDDFYTYLDAICTNKGPEGISFNPYCHLYVLVDERKLVKGFLWFEVHPLTKDVIVNTYSVHPSLWGKGAAIQMAKDLLLSFMKGAKLKKVIWFTNYPWHYERYGFKRSKSILMEYEDGEERLRGASQEKGCESAEPPAGEVYVGDDADGNSSCDTND